MYVKIQRVYLSGEAITGKIWAEANEPEAALDEIFAMMRDGEPPVQWDGKMCDGLYEDTFEPAT